MWGEPERAFRLEPSDSLAAVLFQITGPAHVPWADPRWHEFWPGYPVWVHVEVPDGSLSTTTGDTTKISNSSSSSTVTSAAATGALRKDPPSQSSCLQQACRSLIHHAPRSSNLAAMAMHVTRMLREITATATRRRRSSSTGENNNNKGQQFSRHIALVGQAQATAGALNLFRILCHAVLVHAASLPTPTDRREYCTQCFTFTSRESNGSSTSTTNSESPVIDTSNDLLAALLQFLFVMEGESGEEEGRSTSPELYDATVLALHLLLVLFAPQLYQPMQSSFQRKELQENEEVDLFFWDLFIRQAQQKCRSSSSSSSSSWTPASLLSLWFTWQIQRPPAPSKSIARHNTDLIRSVVQAKGEHPGPDGMYESYLVVDAMAPSTPANTEAGSTTNNATTTTLDHHRHYRESGSSKILMDATRGVLVFSSSIILLPFRLMSLVLTLWRHRENGYDTMHKQHLQTSFQYQSRTKDVLWLSDSPLADMASCLLLLVANNNRSEEDSNPFRLSLCELKDNRWESNGNELPDLPDFPKASSIGELISGEEVDPLLNSSTGSPLRKSVQSSGNSISINFEALFTAFGRTVHNEVGAFLLYTIMQASKSFADSIAVRSDLDTLVLPLLRTLYFACSTRHYVAQDFSERRRPSIDATTSMSKTLSIRNCPFRSASQLYVIIILLLLFSQDPSFGPDAFRRVMVPTVSFYKERNLKDISLGSVLVLSILRCLTFNLHRLGDPFLLSNCCAILMNLSPSITELYDYSAMRLASITFSSMKKYALLRKENPQLDEDVDYTSPTAMYGEVSRTLLRVLRQCVSTKNVEGNLRLVYSLVYHQNDFLKIVNGPNCPFVKQEFARVEKAIKAAASVIEKADARTASKALKVLTEEVSTVREAVSDSRKKDTDDFTFTYEEEADPEIFFVPYLWEVVVCAVTASSVEWQKQKIRVFPLLEVEDAPQTHAAHEQASFQPQAFSEDVSDVV